MILRKPFAFFIKHFKFIHLILTICSIFLIIKTNSILSFYLEYMDLMNVTGNVTASPNLFGLLLVFCIVVMIFGSILILILMKLKNKPILFYIINIFVYIFLGVVYLFSYSVIQSLEIGMVDIRTLKLLQDFLVISMIIQIISITILSIRTLGFNVKKFDFEKDLQELEINSSDSEEVEVNLEFDFDKFKRNTRKRIRHFKYVYAENKITINVVSVIIVIFIAIFIYIRIGVYQKIYKENQIFNVIKYQLNVKNTYQVTTDYQGNIIDDDIVFIIANIDIKTLADIETKFDSARLSLEINDHMFHHQREYKDLFDDLGVVYNNQKVNNDNNNYVFVFAIPENYQNKKMVLKYFDQDNKEINIKINPDKFDNKKLYNYNLGDTINFSDSFLGNTTLKIDSFEVNDYFKNNYEFCYDNNCLNSYEYLVPTYTGNEDKSLMKINGSLNWDENNRVRGIDDLFGFIEIYGKIVYENDKEEETMNINLKQVKPNKKANSDTYYIEITKNVKKADKIYIDLVIRDKEYKYRVK